MSKIINNIAALSEAMNELRAAQDKFSQYSQAQVDKIFSAAAAAANDARLLLARSAADETGMGLFEDKVLKNHFAAEYIHNAYKNTKTCGVIEQDASSGIQKIAEPVGVIAALIPTTNPTSTAIFKTLIALKTRNGIIISPHPGAKKSTILAAKAVLEAAVSAGAPEGIIRWIDEPSKELTGAMMRDADIILATGGPAMVKAAYSSGKPALGVGAGNTPAVIDKSADLLTAVNSVIHSKTFDNGVICASEQSIVVHADIYEAAKKEFEYRGAYFPNDAECDLLRDCILTNGVLNAKTVGQSAEKIAALAGFEVPAGTKLLICEVNSADADEALAHEKLSPVLAMYRAKSFDDALDIAEKLLALGGLGHTAALYADPCEKKLISDFSHRMRACRILINTPAAQGGIGDIYNFKLTPSLTLGCGTRGGNSVSENVGVRHLLNIKTVAERRENMLWFRAPEKVYIKRGCFGTAFDELRRELNKTRAFIVTDSFLYKNGYTAPITKKLDELGIANQCFSEVTADPTLSSATAGARAMLTFRPDVIIAFGGGSAMDAAKIMWVLYEHPELEFSDLAMRFADIRKRIHSFPQMGTKAYFVAVPTTGGTGSEVTPFAVITDEKNGIKYPLADYQLLPNMAIIDADFHMSAPPALTAASGIDAAVHALEAYASMMSTDFTDALCVKALRLIFEYLPRAYKNGEDAEAREKLANAAAISGMAFANAFLGLCHSMAHKLGALHHLPHGVANALLICEIIRFNSAEAPAKMGGFPQYRYPHARKCYAELAEALGLGGADDAEKTERLIGAIEELKKKLGIKGSIQEYGVAESDFLSQLDEMTLQAFDDQCTGANPRYPLLCEIRQIYLNAYYKNAK